MLINYLKLTIRNLSRNKSFSIINIAGLAMGMALVIVIGLWIFKELTFDKSFSNYSRIGQAYQFVTFTNEKVAYNSMPVPLADEMRKNYPDFDAVSVTTYTRDAIFQYGDKVLSSTGMYAEPDLVKMLDIIPFDRKQTGLEDPGSILISQELATKIFGDENPVGKILKINNKMSVTVKSVYDNLPYNSSFKDTYFIAPWQLLAANDDYARRAQTEWDENSFQIFVQLKKESATAGVSQKIKDIRMKKDNPPSYKPEFFIHPMSKWHLYPDFKNGVNAGGPVYFLWMFGLIGFFVLILACCNFMNLSTARTEKRSKEIGIRKAVGSGKAQLVLQFLSESVAMSFIAFIVSLLLVVLGLPFFNSIAGNEIDIPYSNLYFWIGGVSLSVITGIIAGSYPAFYLASLQPLKVLKGKFKAGKWAGLPRKVLVVFQFTVSVVLIIAIITVYMQINHARNRPVNYSREQLVEVRMSTPDFAGKYDAMRSAFMATGVVENFAQSSGSITEQYGGTVDFNWEGKPEGERPLFMRNQVTHDFGATVGWKIIDGRDFSRDFQTDTSAIILNEAALKIMGIKNPVGKSVRLGGRDYVVTGVVKDMIKESPFSQVPPSLFTLDYGGVNNILIKLSKNVSAATALEQIKQQLKNFVPAAPFEYSFVDEKYNTKFEDEQRIGKLATLFTSLAIIISCLGLFALSAFTAEQKAKEISIRKLLGASVFQLWRKLSVEFLLLVLLSCCIAIPLANYFLDKWLSDYSYRIVLDWKIFIAALVAAVIVTLVTVSYVAIKAAIANPIKSLRTE